MKFKKKIKIDNFVVSEDSPVFFIAEAGVNHNGSLKLAKRLVDIACEAGADAVKFQHFKTDELILKNVAKASYQKVTTNCNESQYNMLKKLELNKNELIQLKKYCEKKSIVFLVTPFDESSLNELEKIGIPAYKISSTDVSNLLFLKKIAKTGKPIILSSGMAFLDEIVLALKEIYAYNKEVILLQCTSNYPVKKSDINLKVIPLFIQRFKMLVGFSDHSVGIKAIPYAVASGAKVVEKHFTINRSMPGPDHKASLSPRQLKEVIKQIRELEIYMGRSAKKTMRSEVEVRKSLSKYLVAACNIKKGRRFTEDLIAAKRTGGIGIPAIEYRKIINKKSSKDYIKNEIITG